MSFYLSGGLTLIFGDPVVPGRVVSLLALAATAVGIFGLVRRLGATAAAGVVGALSFVATFVILYRWWPAAAEPQMLAHALITGGTALLVGGKTRRMAILAAVLMVLGGLTKHIPIALPLASAAWLAIYRRKLLYPWLATGLIISSAALIGLVAVYGQAFIDNITIPRTHSLDHMGSNLARGITKSVVPLFGFLALAM